MSDPTGTARARHPPINFSAAETMPAHSNKLNHFLPEHVFIGRE